MTLLVSTFSYANATQGAFHARLTRLCIEGIYKSRNNILEIVVYYFISTINTSYNMDAGCDEDLLVVATASVGFLVIAT